MIHPDIQKCLDQLKADYHSLDGVILGEGYIIEVEGVAIRFNEEGINACRAINANRFDEITAKRLALNFKNGNGKHGEAIHLRQSIENSIKFVEEMIKEIQ